MHTNSEEFDSLYRAETCTIVCQKAWDPTGWFISNGTVKNTDLSADVDVLTQKNCMAGNLWNHGMYLCMNFNSLIIFGYQY